MSRGRAASNEDCSSMKAHYNTGYKIKAIEKRLKISLTCVINVIRSNKSGIEQRTGKNALTYDDRCENAPSGSSRLRMTTSHLLKTCNLPLRSRCVRMVLQFAEYLGYMKINVNLYWNQCTRKIGFRRTAITLDEGIWYGSERCSPIRRNFAWKVHTDYCFLGSYSIIFSLKTRRFDAT